MSAVTQENLLKLKDILQQLDERVTATDVKNRRGAQRIAIHTELSVLLLTGMTPSTVEAFSRNISVSGIGFVSKRMFRRDEYISVPLRFANLPGKLILAKITFGRYLRAGLYEMGAEFHETVSNAKGNARLPDHWITLANAARHSAPPQD